MRPWRGLPGQRGQYPFVPSTLRAVPANGCCPFVPRQIGRLVPADPEQGTLADVSDEPPRWFAAPLSVSAAEAQGPARLLIDTTGGAVPTDLIKTIWVNGQPVPARIEFVSTQRYGLEQGEQTTSGKRPRVSRQARAARRRKGG